MTQKASKPSDLIDLNEVRIAARALLEKEKLPEEIEEELRTVVPRYRKLLCLFATSCSEGHAKQRQNALRRLEQSEAAKLVAFILANGRGNIRQMSWANIKQASRRINPRKPADEYVLADIREKSNGGSRMICAFGPISRGAQKFVEYVVLSVVGHSRFEHARRGRGREVAIRETLQNIKTKGVWWFGLLDVKNFFPSITREMVKDVLGFLPMSYIEASLFIHKETEIRHKRLYEDGKNKSSEAAIRNGLPQGSLASVLVASKVLEEHLDALQARHATSHVDDLLIGGKTEAEVYAKIYALASSLEGHHSGSLHLTGRVCEIGDPRMNYLGYRIRARSAQFGGYGRAMFSEVARQRFLERLASKLLFAHWETRGATIDEECARWVRSFPCWENRLECEDIAVIDAFENLLPSVELAGRILFQSSAKWTSINDLRQFRSFASLEIAKSAGRNFTTGGDLNLRKLNRLAANLQTWPSN